MDMEQGPSTMVPFGERAQAIASYTGLFQVCGSGEFGLMVEKQVVGPALAGGETVLGEGHRVRRQDDPRQGRQGTFRGRPVE